MKKVNPKRIKAIALYQQTIDKRLKSEYNLSQDQINQFWETVFYVMRRTKRKTEKATEFVLERMDATVRNIHHSD